MSKSNFKNVDLLRKRRESNSFQEPFFIDTRKYIIKGIYLGLSIISVSVLIGAVFIVRSNIIQRKKFQIKPLVDEYNSLQLKLDKESKQLKSVAEFNRNLKDSIVNVSSSSALLSEISSKIPKNIQLINLNSSNSILTLKSKVPESKALNFINGFMISLDNSEFINFDEIDLEEIDLEEIKEVEKESGSSNYFIVNINTKITTNFEDINRKYLKKLGSEGLSNRIDILKSFDK